MPAARLLWFVVFHVFYKIMLHLFHTDIPAASNIAFGLGTGSILLSGLGCTGLESSLLSCTRNNAIIGSTSCSHSQDASVYCYEAS